MNESMECEIGFADGVIDRIERSGEQVRVIVKAWNDKEIAIEFSEVVGVRESLCGEISDVIISDEKDGFWEWATSRAYDGPSAAIEKSFRFIDNDDSVCLEVIAKHAKTTVLPS